MLEQLLPQIIEIKKQYLQNCAPFTNWISEIKNTLIDNAKGNDVVMDMHNLIEYSEHYLQTSGSLWLYCRDQQALDNNGSFTGFPANDDTSLSFKYEII